jgi:SEL1 protein
MMREQYGNWSHPRDYPTAYNWYKQLADLSGNSTAQHMVGFMHATGIGGAVPKDQGKVKQFSYRGVEEAYG